MGNWRNLVVRKVSGQAGLDGEVLARAPGWLWPYWAERQLDPESPFFVPRGPVPTLANITTRNWTVVGNLASYRPAFVDPRGLVTPGPGGWSLDWWIGAEDRWHVPAREAAVRQSLSGSVPVVETAMRIPGGDAVQRVYAVPAPAGSPIGELAIVEIENLSPVPVAVAFAIRPYNPAGLAPIHRIEFDDRTVLVDGRPALLLPRVPSGVAGSTLAAGDSVHRVMAGQTSPGPLALEDPDGLAQAACVYPLPHRGVLRVALPLTPEPPRRKPATAPLDTARLPAATDVTRSWQAHLRRGLRLELPDSRLQSAIDANRAYLLLFHTGASITPTPWSGTGTPFSAAAPMLVTLDHYGFHTEAAEVLASRLGGQSPPGRGSTSGRADAGAAIWALAHHHRLTGDSALLGELIPAVGDSLRRLASPASPGDSYEEAFWSLRGLVDAAWLLRLAGDKTAADDAEAAAGQLRDAITASLEASTTRLGRLAIPAGASRGLDPGMVRSLVACTPLGLLPPTDPWVAGTLGVVRDRFCLGDAFYDPAASGLAPAATLLIAACELEAGEQAAWRRLRWVLDAATATSTWPEAVHPRLGGGCGGDGHHGGVAAAFLGFVRQVLIRETADGAVALATLFPADWAGQPVEVHDAPTRYGRVSYALRWHGDRPALLWHCERAGVKLTVPGLDRSFSTTEPSGEALLAPYRARIPIPLQDA